jgi:hypothetical protein
VTFHSWRERSQFAIERAALYEKPQPSTEWNFFILAEQSNREIMSTRILLS